MVGARQKLEDRVGLEVASRVTDVLAEGEAWLSRTDSEAGLSGSDIVYTQWPHTGRGLGPAVAADRKCLESLMYKRFLTVLKKPKNIYAIFKES